MVGREKRPKGQYGSVKLEMSNWRKISAFKANKPFANKTLRAGERYAFCKVSQWVGSCSLETHELPFAKKIQSVFLRKASESHMSD